MSINKFIFIGDNFNDEIIISSKSQIYILCIPSSNYLNLEIRLKILNSSHSELNLVILSDKNVEANIESFLKTSNSISKIKVFAIALNDSIIKVNINSIIPENNINSNVDQKIKGILLSDDSQIIGNPKLKIDSNEAIATHALSIGGIDKEEEFYLLSKGFSKFQAKELIINSYINNVLNSLSENEYNKYIKMIHELIKKG